MKTGRILLGVVLFLFVCSFATAHAVTLGFSPTNTNLTVGDTFNVDLVIGGLAGDTFGYSGVFGDDLSTFDLVVNYDSSLLGFIGYTLGTQLGDLIETDPDPLKFDPCLYDADDLSTGDSGQSVHLSELSWLLDLSSQPDSFSIATISFSALFAGSADLSIAQGIDPNTPLLGDYSGDPLSLDPDPGIFSITISEKTGNPVPEPGTMMLLGIGLIGLGAAVKRRMKRV